MKDLEYYMGLPYRVEVIEDKEEGGYTLHCPELNGCMTCADTVEEGFRLLEEAKRSWFAACLEAGTPSPNRPARRITAGSSSCGCLSLCTGSSPRSPARKGSP